MKKIMLCVSLVLCITIFSGFGVSAEVSPKVNIERVNVAGDSNYIDVTISTNFACGGFQGVLKYNTNDLVYCSAEMNQAISDRNSLSETIRTVEGGIKLVVLGDLPTGTTGDFITLRFQGVSATPFSLEQAVFSANNSQKVSAEINEVMFGDANSDYLLNIKDLVRMKKHFLQTSIETNINNLDCDRNGTIESNDIAVFKKFLLNVINYF